MKCSVPTCEADATPGFKRCVPCRDKDKARAQARRSTRSDAGLCACGSTPSPGFRQCEACRGRKADCVSSFRDRHDAALMEERRATAALGDAAEAFASGGDVSDLCQAARTYAEVRALRRHQPTRMPRPVGRVRFATE